MNLAVPRALWAPVLALLAAGLATMAAAQGDIRVSQVANRAVVDERGQPVGAIRGFEFDTATGQVSSLLVALGGAKDFAARMPVPSPFAFDRTPFPVRGNRKELLARGEPPPPPAGTVSTWDVVGAEIKDVSGTVIGRVEDVVVGADGKVKAVVAAFTETFYPEKGLVAVPWTSFDPAGAPTLIAKFSADHIRPASAGPRPPPAPAKQPTDQDVRVANLIGRNVEDKSGKALGRLEDLVVDASGRKVTAIVVASGGGRIAIPLPVAAAKMDDKTLVLDAAPANAAPPAGDALLATRLAQGRLRGPNGDVVGTVRDVVVNLATGSLRYAVARFDPSWVGGGMVVAMVLPTLRRTADGVDIPVDRSVIQNGMMIEEKHWTAATAEQYREYANKYIKGL